MIERGKGGEILRGWQNKTLLEIPGGFFSISSRGPLAETQPGKSGEYPAYPEPVSSITIEYRFTIPVLTAVERTAFLVSSRLLFAGKGSCSNSDGRFPSNDTARYHTVTLVLRRRSVDDPSAIRHGSVVIKEAVATHLAGLREEGQAIPEAHRFSTYIDLPAEKF